MCVSNARRLKFLLCLVSELFQSQHFCCNMVFPISLDILLLGLAIVFIHSISFQIFNDVKRKLLPMRQMLNKLFLCRQFCFEHKFYLCLLCKPLEHFNFPASRLLCSAGFHALTSNLYKLSINIKEAKFEYFCTPFMPSMS